MNPTWLDDFGAPTTATVIKVLASIVFESLGHLQLNEINELNSSRLIQIQKNHRKEGHLASKFSLVHLLILLTQQERAFRNSEHAESMQHI
jgi:hypothetical protein